MPVPVKGMAADAAVIKKKLLASCYFTNFVKFGRKAVGYFYIDFRNIFHYNNINP